jgi:replication-associated recombination protein RarA
MKLPSNYRPINPEDFIGPARVCAEFLRDKLCPTLKADPQSWRVIFSGQPGVGKSALADLLTRLMGANKWNTTRYNRRQVKTEQVEHIASQFHFTDLFGGWRFLIIEELDTIPPDARSRLLTAVDDMPDQWIFAATTNLTKEQLIAKHPALASRYEHFEIEPPSVDEVLTLMERHWPSVAGSIRNQIAVLWNGNVRGALHELNAHLLSA